MPNKIEPKAIGVFSTTQTRKAKAETKNHGHPYQTTLHPIRIYYV